MQRNCLGTIRNIANVCCVQFSPQSSHLLAFGSSDFRTYCYDTRNLRTPWCILSGHNKAVSYAKFLDSETLVTASTDNTLKLWDLKKTTHGGLSTNACGLTFGGHTNEKVANAVRFMLILIMFFVVDLSSSCLFSELCWFVYCRWIYSLWL